MFSVHFQLYHRLAQTLFLPFLRNFVSYIFDFFHFLLPEYGGVREIIIDDVVPCS